MPNISTYSLKGHINIGFFVRMTQINTSKISAPQKSSGNGYLDFEKPIEDLEKQIAELGALQSAKGINYSPEIRHLQSNLVKLTGKMYNNLSGWETVKVARHPMRPILPDYLDTMVKDFRELHGDRIFGDDRAIITGFGRIGREKVMVIGHNKGRTTNEKVETNFGCAHPEGYRKAMLKMKLAEKFNIPIVCIIDTPGAYPGIGAEERGQAQAIAANLMEMSLLRVPIICLVIGEGGSGGALGVGVGDRLAIMQFAYYSVISPEGCAAILWKNGTEAPRAAEALKLTSKDLFKLGIVDNIIAEPLGGAHRNPHEATHNVETYLIKTIRELKRYKIENLLENRYRKLRSIGQFTTSQPTPSTPKTIRTAPVVAYTATPTPNRKKTTKF